MKELFDRNQDKMTPEEDRKVWSAVHDALRSPRSGWKRWGVPAGAFGTLAAALAVVIVVRFGGDDSKSTLPLEGRIAAEGASDAEKPAAPSRDQASAPREEMEIAEAPAAVSSAPSAPSSEPLQLAAKAEAQARGGILRGRVTNSQGAPLAFANVILLGTSLGAMTDSLGNFEVTGVPSGSYTVRTSYLGYEPKESRVKVETGALVAESFQLAEAQVAELGDYMVRGTRMEIRRDATGPEENARTKDREAKGDGGSASAGIASPAMPAPSQLHENVEGKSGREMAEALAPKDLRALVAGERVTRNTELGVPRSAAKQKPLPGRDWPISVGGTDPVNGQAFDSMFFQHYGVNPFVDPQDDRFATFAVDVDNASFAMARAYLDRGEIPPPEAIRVEEFVNALRHDYEPPLTGLIADRRGEPSEHGTFAIHLEAAPSPFGKGLTLVRVGLKGREIDVENRKPAVLTFVVDVSGSMAREDRLELVKKALFLLLDQMNDEDEVALVVYGSNARTLLSHTSLRHRREIENAIAGLHPEGATNAEAGLREGYALADRGYRRGWINRIILCSDGVANVGETGAEGILDKIKAETARGINLTAVGFGMGNYNDVLMEKLADQGDGNYYYVDALDEARRVFVENLTGTLQVIARQTKIQVEFDPQTVRRYRLLGYENRDVADRDFRNDAVDAGEVGAGHEVTALFEVKLEPDARRGELATVRIRYEDPDTRKVTEEARAFRVDQIEPRLAGADPSFRMDAAAAELAEILRHSYWAQDGDLARVAGLARDAARDLPRRQDVEALVAMTETAAKLWPRNPAPQWQDDVRPSWEPDDEDGGRR